MAGIITTPVQLVLFACNIILLLFGVALVIIGWMIRRIVVTIQEVAGDETKMNLPFIVVIGVGIIVILLGFLGCCGAITEDPGMLTCYGAALFIILIAEIALVALTVNSKESIKKVITDGLEKAFDHLNVTEKPIQQAWDTMQKELHCCGTKEGAADYTKRRWNVTESCKCVEKSDQCDNQGFYQEGCLKKFNEYIDKQQSVVIAACAIIGAVQLLLVCFACCLANQIRSGHRYSK